VEDLDPNLLKAEEMFEKEEMNFESLFRKRKKIYSLLSSTFTEKSYNPTKNMDALKSFS
jgi:hypothetical protein